MTKTKAALVVGLAMVAAGFSIEAIISSHRETTSAYNTYWQEHFTPRVKHIIAGLEARGVDTTRAKAICLQPLMNPISGDACVTELERENNLSPDLQ